MSPLQPFAALCLCLCLSQALAQVQGQGLGSPLKVAQCRAKCIHVFPDEYSVTNTCVHTTNCQMCWDQCQRLQAGWSASCDRDTDCGPGCRQACRFHLQLEVQRSPVLVTRGEEVIEQGADVVSWPAAAPTTATPSVYVLMCRQLDNSWTQVVQTLALSWRMSGSSCSTVRVMVVGLDGLVTVYSPVPKPLKDANFILRSVGRDIWQSLGLAQNKSTEALMSNDVNTNSDQDGAWGLREVSLIHQGVLVIAEVAWEPQRSSASPVYLVTWELAGGGLKGNLLTDSTQVTLSLWPDTVYRIQVQVVQDPRRLSEPLVLDTRRAAPLLTTPHRPPPLGGGHPGLEGVAGAACAVLLFLAVLLLISGRSSPASNSRDKAAQQHDLSNHFKLFPPPVTLLLERPRATADLHPLVV